MECVAFEYVLDFVSAKSLKMQHFFQIKAELFPAFSMVTTVKRLWNASTCDMTSGSHSTSFVFLGCIFC